MRTEGNPRGERREVLCFGGTKNGLERASWSFSSTKSAAPDFGYRVKQGGHLALENALFGRALPRLVSG